MTIKEYRQAAGLTQRQFAELFDISIDTVKAWDCGRRKPDKLKEKLIIEKLEQMHKEGKMDNRYYNFTDAVKAAEKIIGDSLLEDNSGMKWDCFNLLDYPDSRDEGGDAYWCVGHDGSIGYTEDNGYNVRWDYNPVL